MQGNKEPILEAPGDINTNGSFADDTDTDMPIANSINVGVAPERFV